MTAEETFGQQVRRRRLAVDLTQAQLAYLTGVTRGTIRNAEKGRNTPRSDHAETILSVLESAEAGTLDPTGRYLSPDEVREHLARQFELLAAAFPELPADSLTPEAVAARSGRHAYLYAARLARGET